MPIPILDELQQAFVGKGIADAKSFYSVINEVALTANGRILNVKGKDANGGDLDTNIPLGEENQTAVKTVTYDHTMLTIILTDNTSYKIDLSQQTTFQKKLKFFNSGHTYERYEIFYFGEDRVYQFAVNNVAVFNANKGSFNDNTVDDFIINDQNQSGLASLIDVTGFIFTENLDGQLKIIMRDILDLKNSGGGGGSSSFAESKNPATMKNLYGESQNKIFDFQITLGEQITTEGAPPQIGWMQLPSEITTDPENYVLGNFGYYDASINPAVPSDVDQTYLNLNGFPVSFVFARGYAYIGMVQANFIGHYHDFLAAIELTGEDGLYYHLKVEAANTETKFIAFQHKLGLARTYQTVDFINDLWPNWLTPGTKVNVRFILKDGSYFSYDSPSNNLKTSLPEMKEYFEKHYEHEQENSRIEFIHGEHSVSTVESRFIFIYQKFGNDDFERGDRLGWTVKGLPNSIIATIGGHSDAQHYPTGLTGISTPEINLKPENGIVIALVSYYKEDDPGDPVSHVDTRYKNFVLLFQSGDQDENANFLESVTYRENGTGDFVTLECVKTPDSTPIDVTIEGVVGKLHSYQIQPKIEEQASPDPDPNAPQTTEVVHNITPDEHTSVDMRFKQSSGHYFSERTTPQTRNVAIDIEGFKERINDYHETKRQSFIGNVLFETPELKGNEEFEITLGKGNAWKHSGSNQRLRSFFNISDGEYTGKLYPYFNLTAKDGTPIKIFKSSAGVLSVIVLERDGLSSDSWIKKIVLKFGTSTDETTLTAPTRKSLGVHFLIDEVSMNLSEYKFDISDLNDDNFLTDSVLTFKLLILNDEVITQDITVNNSKMNFADFSSHVLDVESEPTADNLDQFIGEDTRGVTPPTYNFWWNHPSGTGNRVWQAKNIPAAVTFGGKIPDNVSTQEYYATPEINFSTENGTPINISQINNTYPIYMTILQSGDSIDSTNFLSFVEITGNDGTVYRAGEQGQGNSAINPGALRYSGEQGGVPFKLYRYHFNMRNTSGTASVVDFTETDNYKIKMQFSDGSFYGPTFPHQKIKVPFHAVRDRLAETLAFIKSDGTGIKADISDAERKTFRDAFKAQYNTPEFNKILSSHGSIGNVSYFNGRDFGQLTSQNGNITNWKTIHLRVAPSNTVNNVNSMQAEPITLQIPVSDVPTYSGATIANFYKITVSFSLSRFCYIAINGTHLRFTAGDGTPSEGIAVTDLRLER